MQGVSGLPGGFDGSRNLEEALTSHGFRVERARASRSYTLESGVPLAA